MHLNTDAYLVDFWKSVYIAAIKSGDSAYVAQNKADAALKHFKETFSK